MSAPATARLVIAATVALAPLVGSMTFASLATAAEPTPVPNRPIKEYEPTEKELAKTPQPPVPNRPIKEYEPTEKERAKTPQPTPPPSPAEDPHPSDPNCYSDGGNPPKPAFKGGDLSKCDLTKTDQELPRSIPAGEGTAAAAGSGASPTGLIGLGALAGGLGLISVVRYRRSTAS